MPPKLDPYRVLGVSQSASQQDITAAYRKKAKTCHPDLFPNNQKAEDDFALLNQAYNLIATASKRKEYDRLNKPKTEAAKPGAPNTANRSKPEPEKPMKRAFEAKPIITRVGKKQSLDTKSKRNPMIIAAGALLVTVFLATIYGYIKTSRDYKRVARHTEYLKKYGEIRDGIIIDNTKIKDAERFHRLTYRFNSRLTGDVTQSFILSKSKAGDFTLKDINQPAAQNKAQEILEKPKEITIDVLTLPALNVAFPAMFLEREFLNDKKIDELDDFVDCIKEANRKKSELDKCSFTVGLPEPKIREDAK